MMNTLQPRRALIIVDAQNEYFDGVLKIDFPDPRTSIVRLREAADAAVAAGIPVVMVQQIAPPDAPVFAQGSVGYQLHPLLLDVPVALQIDKKLPSSFSGTGLAAWLQAQAIDTLTVAGYMTHNCINSTLIDAVHQGWQAEFLADASGSLPYRNAAGEMSGEEAHRVFSVVFQSRFAAVLDTAEWIEGLSSGRRPERDNIPASHRRAVA